MKCVATFLLIMPILSYANSATADIYGEWWTPGFNARVRIDPCGESICGTITWLWDETPPDTVDQQPLVGREIFSRLKRVRPAYWTEGKIYNPEDGRSYSANIELRNETTLEVSGCFLFICRRQVWRRVDHVACPPVATSSDGETVQKDNDSE